MNASSTWNNLVYVADSDAVSRLNIQAVLENEGHQVICFDDTNNLLATLMQKKCDLAIIDVANFGNDGFAIGTRIKLLFGLPTIILTGKNSDDDYVFGVHLGFDACLQKPFNPLKLAAHAKTLLTKRELSRPSQPFEQINKTPATEYADITLCFDSRRARFNDREVRLTNKELNLLTVMIKSENRAISRDELMSTIWGNSGATGIRATDDAIKRLRKKLVEAGSRVSIDTVWGYGFRLDMR